MDQSSQLSDYRAARVPVPLGVKTTRHHEVMNPDVAVVVENRDTIITTLVVWRRHSC